MSSSKSDRDDIDASSAPLLEHLIELRSRLIWAVGGFFVAFLLCFFFAKGLFNALVLPFQWGVRLAGFDPATVAFVYTALPEFFFTQIKIAMFGGLVLAFPLIAMQVYKFIAPGLYRNERAAFTPFLIASPILFLLGAGIVYFFLAPMATWFFLEMQQSGGGDQIAIELLPRVSEYLSFMMTLIFAFGLVFQLPVATTLMARVGMISSDGLRDKRKYAIVFAFVAAAILTPPDPISQIGLALPTIILYEVAIIAARRVERKRAVEPAGEDDTADA